ncbi:potassium voltage-gated channel subfamily KQT member 4-like isoform X2 [Rhopilema esculentum]|uniref:potassium voltage-gated channel subfamily KQT member 4-like isoform X2 n=1 Tax=Rhopilema esculentum TaxID=499914 RepID=UPI0031CE127A
MAESQLFEETEPLLRTRGRMTSQNGKSIPLLTHNRERSLSYKERQMLTSESSNYFPTEIRSLRMLKSAIFTFLEHPNRPVSRLYHSLVIFLILISLGLAIYLTVRKTLHLDHHIVYHYLALLECGLAAIFIIEYLLRIWSCSIKGIYKGFRGTLRFMWKPHMILDFFAILASLTLAILMNKFRFDWAHMRYAMPLQLIRILRIDRERGAFKTFHAVIKNHFKELLTCWYMGFIVVLFLSYLAYAEPVIIGGKQNRTVDDLANGVYWAIVSMTTIGYGDIYPRTVTSKVLLCIFGVVGTGFIALPAGIIGSGFALQVIEQKKKQHNRKRRRPAAMLIQAAWKVWASDLKKNFTATWLPHTKVVKSFKDSELQALFSNPTESFINLPGTSLRYKSGTSISSKGSNVEGTEESTLSAKVEGAYLVYKDLTKGQKIAIGFIRHLKFIVALKYFRRTRKPYDEKDIMDQFAGGQVEIYGQLKLIQRQIDTMNERRETLQSEMLTMQAQIASISMRQEEMLSLVKGISESIKSYEEGSEGSHSN